MMANDLANPMREVGTLWLTTTRPGSVRVGLYDASGRRVRTPLETSTLAAGRHEICLTGCGASDGLRPGLYFYRVEAGEGVLRGRVVVAPR